MTVTVINLMAGMYDVYLYGHGNADDETAFFS